MARTERPVPPAANEKLRVLRRRARALQEAARKMDRARLDRDAAIREAMDAGAPTWAVVDAAQVKRSQVHNITRGAS